jgi:cellulose synthase/poly-beta-1,6-N-acetylglucosamine synthase-like glycosyltransferase
VLETIDALAGQSSRPLEIVVIDSGSSRSILAKLAGSSEGPVPVRLIEIPAEEYQSARTLNRAIAEARGDLCAVLSQDALPADTLYLELLASGLADKRVAGSYARQIPRSPGDPLVEKDLLTSYPPESRLQAAPDCWFSNTCSLLRKSLWERHPFDERAGIAEDHEWAQWAQGQGYLIKYEARARIYHQHDYPDLPELWSRFRDEGSSLARIHGGSPGALRLATRSVREIASDFVWLARRHRLTGWPGSIPRRMVKHLALYWGSRTGSPR